MEINFLKYFTFKRFINLIKIFISFELSKLLRRNIVWGSPITISIEPTNYCNLKCPECPSGTGDLTRPLGMMSLDNFSKLVDDIKDHCFYVQLFLQGEPLLNKKLVEMIRILKSKKIYVSISTNGTLFKRINYAKLLEHPPDKIIFSIDGLDQATYEVYRQGGNFVDALDGLKIVSDYKKNNYSSAPFVEFQMIVMKQNEHQISELENICKEFNVNKLTLKTMQVSSYENAIKFLPDNPNYRRYKVINKSVIMKSTIKNHCFALWRSTVITWDGEIIPCCFDKDADYSFGNVFEKSLSELWKNNSYNSFRKQLLKNRKAVPMCTNCTEGLSTNILETDV